MPVAKVTESGPFLAGLLTAFQNAVNAAKAKYISDFASARTFYEEKFALGLPAANAYFTEHPVGAVAYSQDFLTLLSETKEAATMTLENIVSEGTVGYNTMVANANLDYSNALNQAYEDFNFALNSSYIADPTFNLQYFRYAGATAVATARTLVSIKNASGKYLGISPVVCSMDSTGKNVCSFSLPAVALFDELSYKTMFTVVDLGSGKFAYKHVSGRYLGVDAGALVLKSTGIGTGAIFTVVANGGDSFTLGTSGTFTISGVSYKSLMTIFMDTVAADVDKVSQDSMDEFTAADNAIKIALSGVLRSFVYNRPIVRFTGVGHKPVNGIVFDDVNSFGFEIENIGKVLWQGKVSLKVKDQYQKSITSSSVQVSSLLPGEKRMISMSVSIPKVDPVTGYNFGSKISTLIKFES